MGQVHELDPEQFLRCHPQSGVINDRRNLLAQNRGIAVTHLNRWQWDIHRRLMSQDNRQILFVVDRVGNRGKTFLSLYLNQHSLPCHLSLPEMKQRDLACNVVQKLDLKTVVFDYCRNWRPEFFAWTLFEQLKNGWVTTSGNAEIEEVLYPQSIKVAVLTNHDPSSELHRLSPDRPCVVDLDEEFAVHGEELSVLLPSDPFEAPQALPSKKVCTSCWPLSSGSPLAAAPCEPAGHWECCEQCFIKQFRSESLPGVAPGYPGIPLL